MGPSGIVKKSGSPYGSSSGKLRSRCLIWVCNAAGCRREAARDSQYCGRHKQAIIDRQLGRPQYPKREKCQTRGDELPPPYSFHQTADQNQERTGIVAEEVAGKPDQQKTNGDARTVMNGKTDLPQSPIHQYHRNNDTYSYVGPGFKYQGNEFKYQEYENISLNPLFQFPESNCRGMPTGFTYNVPYDRNSGNGSDANPVLNYDEEESLFVSQEPQSPESNQGGEIITPILDNNANDPTPVAENESEITPVSSQPQSAEKKREVEVIDLTYSPPPQHLEHSSGSDVIPTSEYQKKKNKISITDAVFEHRGNETIATTPSLGFSGLNIRDTPIPQHRENQSTISNLMVVFNGHPINNTVPIYKSRGIQSTVASPVPNIPQHNQYDNGFTRMKMSLSYICH
ncbi:hypothetical protein F5Y00DRAFT_274783 [Daldinia vernicosa]|uniref:uncharacterized protein n=1 Tax=Daldinia vernicosa TaxID=114800 RepID=UPI00200727A4|nr:uncharacterized protein F5Y00DRAFT_274783 [Daldinia vernicosa]KAI0843864.1 hypothetical protein F5Y00DRAFT_274783 [Daldinia vernicosa]